MNKYINNKEDDAVQSLISKAKLQLDRLATECKTGASSVLRKRRAILAKATINRLLNIIKAEEPLSK